MTGFSALSFLFFDSRFRQVGREAVLPPELSLG